MPAGKGEFDALKMVNLDDVPYKRVLAVDFPVEQYRLAIFPDQRHVGPKFTIICTCKRTDMISHLY